MRCNNHKCVKTPLWRGDLTWSWLDHVTWTFMFVVKSCSWLILVQVPSLYLWLWEFFTPPPLTFISSMLHSFYTYSYDTFISRTGILWAKEPPSTLPTRIDSCPPKFFLWYGWVIWIPYPIVTVEPIHFEVWPFLWRSDFSSWDSWKESVTVRRLQHLLTEATSQKSNLHPSQGEKECAACLLMIKHYLKDTCSDCYRIFRGVVFERFPSNSSASLPAAFFQNPGAMEKGAKPISVFLWKSELPREALKQAPSGSGGKKSRCDSKSLRFQ